MGDGSVVQCFDSSLILARDRVTGVRHAILLTEHDERERLQLEILANETGAAQALVSKLRASMDELSVYRGMRFSIASTVRGLKAEFRTTKTVSRDDLILPQATIEEIERHTVRFSNYSSELRRRGQHLKRGLLLYGPPGTGKSLTIAYLLSAMPNRSAIILNGRSMASLNDACALARAIQPATIVIDDADLIAESRVCQSTNSVLFDLLEQMDGVDQDADVLFLLTTNRPEILEPAISERPGRIDQAIEIPLPDADCRERLFGLYSANLAIKLSDTPALVAMTDGTSAAFLRELFRRSALLALEEGADVVITDRHVEQSFAGMRASQFTRSFLGDQKKLMSQPALSGKNYG